MDGEKYAETGVFGAGIRGYALMRRFHWRGAVALNPPTGCHGRMVAVGEGAPYFVRCSELTGAPHHTLAPVSFPSSPSTNLHDHLAPPARAPRPVGNRPVVLTIGHRDAAGGTSQ